MEIKEVVCRTIVNRTGGFLAGFTHTINPYHGCSFGRTLCGLPDYAPAIAVARGEKRAWGSYLDVKINGPEIYEKDHDRIRAGPRPEIRIFMSSVTDPWVPQERRYRITRGILDRMRDRPPDLLTLQTHTPNPLWDIDRLEALSSRFPLSIQVSVETDRETLGPPFPRHAYPVAARIEALRRMKERGLHTVGVVSPLWPIEDAEGFARRLDEACEFVVLDHYRIGDGSPDGARTKRRLTLLGSTFPDLLTRGGHGDWNRLESLDEVVRIFRQILGVDRVGVSKQGFDTAAHRLLSGGTMNRAVPLESEAR